MASTSDKKSQTRSAPSVNYSNDYYTQPTPRQILPMSRNTPQQQQRIFLPQNRSYTQAQSPQIIVPTQFGSSGDFSMNNISSSKDTYMSSSSMPNVPIDYYPGYYQNPIQQYPNYLQQQLMHPQQQQQLQPQPIGPHQSQPDLLPNTMHYVDMSRTVHQSTQQSPQIQSDINPQQPQQVLPTQVPSQHTLQQVVAPVPTQSVAQPPPLQPATRKDFLRRDVFFSSAQSCDDDFMDSAQFDSDTSSDTEVFTPGRSNSPSLSPTSPAEFLGGEEEFRLFYNNESDDEEKKDSIAIIQQPSSRTSSSRKPSSKATNKSSAISGISSTPGDESSTVNLNMISSIFNSMELASSESINPMLLTNDILNNDSLSSTVSDAAVTDATMSPRLARPNHIEIEINNDIPSPPLRTPELISDTRTKRKASYISSDEGSSDSEMSVDKITKKACDDNRTGIVTALDSDSKQTRGSPIDIDDDSHVRPCDEQDEYTASSDSASTDTEEDDDEEYRPSSSIKKQHAVKKFNTKAQQLRVKVSTPKTVASSPATLPKAKTLSKSKSKTKNTSARRSAKVTLKTSKKPTKPVISNTPLVESPSPSESSLVDNELHEEESMEQLETCDPCPTQSPTIFETLTQAGVDWCRYCGTTEGVNWRPGPWGKRTLCNKHGCDYKGYGFACKLPRLDLTGFVDEAVEKRDRPVLQLFCTVCHKQESYVGNVLVRCEGCPRAFHQKCHPTCIDDETVSSGELWYCERSCQDNLRRRRIVVELPRKRLPLMSTPKAQCSTSSESTPSTSTGTASRPRTSRNSTRP